MEAGDCFEAVFVGGCLDGEGGEEGLNLESGVVEVGSSGHLGSRTHRGEEERQGERWSMLELED